MRPDCSLGGVGEQWLTADVLSGVAWSCASWASLSAAALWALLPAAKLTTPAGRGAAAGAKAGAWRRSPLPGALTCMDSSLTHTRPAQASGTYQKMGCAHTCIEDRQSD